MAADTAPSAPANQSPLLEDVNLYATDIALQEAVRREGGGAAAERLAAFGKTCGGAEAIALGRLANESPPRLRTHDAKGRRIDQVEFHPAYHACMTISMAEGLHASVWDHLAKPANPGKHGAHVARAGAFYLAAQMEAGHCCPITMTSAAVATLMLQPDLASVWLPRVLGRTYDQRVLPAAKKSAVTIGMGMTEKQGGTDVRANVTRAVAANGGGAGREYRISGHKWFLSAPMSDAFLMLAQAPGGLSCFLVPRWRDETQMNALRLQRLKDKLGNRSNASSEVELEDASGWLVGEEGRGVPAIIEMVTATRLDCAIASAGLMRRAVVEAIHHARHRRVFDRALADQPIMQQVLADLVLDVEAATALAFRLARAFDRADAAPAGAWRRLMTPVTKYWVCKMAPALVAEAMECLGGNGYVEESLLPRIYREVPVNAIWEGSGNVMALDVLRVLQREPEVVASVLAELEQAAGDDPHMKAAVARLQGMLHEPRLLDARARALVEGLAVTAAATILRAHAPAPIADAFVATRLAGGPRYLYGQGLERFDVKSILARAHPPS